MLSSFGFNILDGIQDFQNQIKSDMNYHRSRKDAIEFWNMQNAYNAPKAQMQRLKEAGLNPNLIYGGSSGGASGTAGAIMSPEYGQVLQTKRENPFIESYDLKLKQATLSNVLAQNEAIREEANLKRAQIRDIIAGASRKEFDLGFETEFRPFSGDIRVRTADRLGAEIAKIKAETLYQLDENERRELLTASNIREATSRILSQRQQRAQSVEETRRIQLLQQLLQSDVRIRQYQEKLMRDYGVTPGNSLPKDAVQMWWKFLDSIYEKF